MKRKLCKIGAFILAAGLVFTGTMSSSFAESLPVEKDMQIKENEEPEDGEKTAETAGDKKAEEAKTVDTEDYRSVSDKEQPVANSIKKVTDEGIITASKAKVKKAERKSSEFDLNEWQYREENSEIILIKYKGTASDIIVPGTHNGKQIVLNGEVFSSNQFLKNIVIGSEQSKVKGAASLYKLFSDCSNLTSIDISGFDTSKVTNMSCMFNHCSNLTNIDVSSFDTSKVTNMSDMFNNCSNLTNIDVSSFDTSKVTNMSGMFSNCGKSTNIDVSSFDTSNVTNMFYMFTFCTELTNIDVSGFDTSKVTNMSNMFRGCRNLTNVDVSSFDTSKVTNMSIMFYDCRKLANIDVSGFDISNVSDMSGMFSNCSTSFFDLSRWNDKYRPNVKVDGMFERGLNIPTVIISNNINLMEIGLKNSNRVPYTAQIGVSDGYFNDQTNVTANSDGETKTLGKDKIIYSSLDEYEREFKYTRKEIVDMIRLDDDLVSAGGFDEYVWTAGGSMSEFFLPDDQIIDFTMGNLTKLELSPVFKVYPRATVQYDTDGGTAIPDETVRSIDKIIPDVIPVKQGYTFEGWMFEGRLIDSDTTAEDIVDFSNITPGSACKITLTAKWNKNETIAGIDNNKPTNTDTTAKSDTNTTTKTAVKTTAKTGDNTKPLLAAVLAACSLIIMMLFLQKKIKR